MNNVSAYLQQIDTAFAAGNATEHTHRPALKALIETLEAGIVATNEPKRIRCGAPDFILTRGQTPLGYVEAKDIGKPLDVVEADEQLKRYRESLGNLVLTDYLEFRWYVGGEKRLTARLASVVGNKIRAEADGEERVSELLHAFLRSETPTVSSPRELAQRMAHLARLICDIIARAVTDEEAGGSLHQQMEGFRKTLLHDLTEPQFADMYAQTICYGLFAARCNTADGPQFSRYIAPHLLPKTNPFLRKTFGYIAGPDLDERIVWAVDDLANLLSRADMAAILADFGKRTKQEDPVVHFYETFLAAYDPKMREARGVYYTPEPVVDYLVRSVDWLLRKVFGLSGGLADSSKVKIKVGKESREVHKVQLLDPSTGTATFLYRVINKIHESFAGNKGMWSGYVREHLLPRLTGFELLMAPYAVAHLKLGLLLASTGYDFESSERLRVFLTNTLDEADEFAGANLFAQWLADEANAASLAKSETPVMVVIGNPPYSGHSANTGEWIAGLLRGKDSRTGGTTGNYFEVDGRPLGERNPKWLNDDYVKFIRFAQWRIEKTGFGILAFITNHGYLDNPTFRGMRQSLMETFDDIYVMDLHGNSKKKERTPDGSKDENVFDIQQGVAICLMVKRSGASKPATVRHAPLWGSREDKYKYLLEADVSTTEWNELAPSAPLYMFVPQDTDVRAEYELGYRLLGIFSIHGVGMTTARDHMVIDFEKNPILERAEIFRDSTASDAELCRLLSIPMKEGWNVAKARQQMKNEKNLETNLKRVLYRPFDERHILYHDALVWRTVKQVMSHMLAGRNLGFITTRQTRDKWDVFATRNIMGHKTVAAYDINSLFPLYLYSTGEKTHLFDEESEENERRANLAPAFVEDLANRLALRFVPDGTGDLKETFGPEDVFHYMYAVFHSPTYRSRYAEFLKTDFPRLPLTSSPALFRTLCELGRELTALHLMEKTGAALPSYPVNGTNVVEAVRYSEPTADLSGRVRINREQYFDGVAPEVWQFQVGGYQVCQKWLKDRKGRTLVYDDLLHYQRVCGVLAETIHLMKAVDDVIQSNGGFPLH